MQQSILQEVSRIGQLRLLFLMVLVASAFSTIVMKPTLALIKVHQSYSCSNIQNNYACVWTAYSIQGYLALYNYLDTTTPSGQQACVGYIPVGSSNLYCAYVTGSGSGLSGPSGGNVYPACANTSGQTLSYLQCSWTAYYD